MRNVPSGLLVYANMVSCSKAVATVANSDNWLLVLSLVLLHFCFYLPFFTDGNLNFVDWMQFVGPYKDDPSSGDEDHPARPKVTSSGTVVTRVGIRVT